MKRIAICWHELADRGIPTSLHLNARTERDWQRWREFLRVHPEICSVSFEFGTGAAPKARAHWYVQQLIDLTKAVGRRLQLVVRGGRSVLPELRQHFQQVAFIASDPLMRTRKRRKLVCEEGLFRWKKFEYVREEKLDRQFLENLAVYAALVRQANL